MHTFHLKPPRLWYQKTYITQTQPQFQDQYANLLKDTELSLITISATYGAATGDGNFYPLSVFSF